MNILVAGGAGFIGSHLVDALIAEGHRVAVIDDLSHGKKENVNQNAKLYALDISSSEAEEVFKKERPRVLFHYAAQVSVRKSLENPVEDAKTNILGSLNLFNLCKRYGVEKIIFASTGGAMYGDADRIPTPETYPANPSSPYGIAKRSVEMYLEYYRKVLNIPSIVLRLANVYGPRQDYEGEAGVVAIFSHALKSGTQPTIFGDGNQTRDFIFVEDVVRANLLALKSHEVGTFNIGTGVETNVNELFSHIQQILGISMEPIRAEARTGEQQRSCLDASLAKHELNWAPKYALKEGLQKTLNL